MDVWGPLWTWMWMRFAEPMPGIDMLDVIAPKKKSRLEWHQRRKKRHVAERRCCTCYTCRRRDPIVPRGIVLEISGRYGPVGPAAK